MKQCHYRLATLADIPQLLELEQRCFDPHYFPLYERENFRYALSKGKAKLIVAEYENKLCGYVLIFFRAAEQSARIYSIAVDPVWQGQKIGSRLLKEVEKIAAHCKKIFLEVRRDHEATIKFYQAHGYRQEKVVANYYPDTGDAVKMLRKLSTDCKIPATSN